MHDLLKKYQNIIKEYRILLWENEPTSSRFKAEIIFKNQSILYIREYRFPTNRKYVYHWQDKDNKLIIRWDNAPHWGFVSTFPHHKHIGTETNVVDSTEVLLEDVLEIIYKELTGGSKKQNIS